MAKQLDLSNIELENPITFGGDLLIECEQDFPAPPTCNEVIEVAEEVVQEEKKVEEVIDAEHQENCQFDITAVENLGIGSSSYLQKLAIRIKERPAKINTGLKELNEVTGGGWPCGISVVAALPNVGKTTILLQSAAAMAMEGTVVVYLSHDMRELDLTAKVISHTSYKLYGSDCYTLRDILADNILGDESQKSKNTLAEVERTQKNLFIRDLIYDPEFNDFCSKHLDLQDSNIIERIFNVYSSTFKKVVFICDSLQQIAAYNKGGSGKDAIDKQLQEFKQLSTYYEVPLILISTLNRSAYGKNAATDFSGLKESGSIEYDADTILMAYPKVDVDSKEDFNMDEFREKEYRDITIKCIKSRDSGYKQKNMTLYAPGCTFIECKDTNEKPTKAKKTSKSKVDTRMPPNRNYM